MKPSSQRHRSCAPLLVALTLAFLLPSRAAAQSSDEVNAAGLQFNLSNPGARSLALGGAFNAAADDATAAYANPAGLVSLSRPEVSFEGRSWKFTNFYTDRGNVAGPPSGQGIDTRPGLVEGLSHDSATGLSFLSYVYPSPSGRWAAAVYRHELGAFRSTAHTQGAFYADNDGATLRFSPIASNLALNMDSYGAAFSYKVNDALAAGVSVARYQFELHSLTNRYFFSLDKPPTPPPGAFDGPPLEEPANVRNFQTQDGRDSAFAWNAGVLWKITSAGSQLNTWGVTVGAVYKRGSEYDMTVRSADGPHGQMPFLVRVDTTTKFHVPTEYGAGVTVRTPDLSTSVGLDCNRILYSSLTSDFVTIFGEENHYHVPNGTELHVGLEHLVIRFKYPLALRVGAWRDPDHRIAYIDPNAPASSQSLLFRAQRADRHVSAGFGVTLSERYSIDAAVDRSRRQQIASVSMVARFGRDRSTGGKNE
jgi:long-subunit fatty acid transport protein